MLGTRILVLAAGLATFLGCATASATQAGTIEDANITGDFSLARGTLSRMEGVDTSGTGDPEPVLREHEIAFSNDQGLWSDIVRIGIGLGEDKCDLQAHICGLSDAAWMFDVATLTSSLVFYITPEGLIEDDPIMMAGTGLAPSPVHIAEESRLVLRDHNNAFDKHRSVLRTIDIKEEASV
jgi:hypothetical protein